MRRALPSFLAVTLAITTACAGGESSGQARHVRTIEGFAQPESVRYDAAQDIYFVSNMAGFGSVKDSIAYISRVSADDLLPIDMFIESGRNGVLMHAPKGMALQGDTLWVADIDVVRAFDRRTGAVLANLDLAPHGAVLLNDIALGPDGALLVTDTGINMSPVGVLITGGSKIFAIRGPQHTIEVAAQADIEFPNGITWDDGNERWLVVTFHPFQGSVYAMTPELSAPEVVAQGKGRFDGIEVLEDGRMVVTAWSDSSLHLIDADSDRRIIGNLWQPADPGYDTRRNRVAIPLVLQGLVQFWEMPER